MKSFLTIFGAIFTIFILVFGTQAFNKMYPDFKGDSESTTILVFVHLFFLLIGLVPLIIGLSIKKKNKNIK